MFFNRDCLEKTPKTLILAFRLSIFRKVKQQIFPILGEQLPSIRTVTGILAIDKHLAYIVDFLGQVIMTFWKN